MEPRRLNATHKFEKEVELAKRRGKDTGKMRAVIDLLVHRKPLPRELNGHPLKGKFKGYRDLHIEPDCLFTKLTTRICGCRALVPTLIFSVVKLPLAKPGVYFC